MFNLSKASVRPKKLLSKNFLILSTGLLLGVTLSLAASKELKETLPMIEKRQHCDAVSEPSGVVQLPDGHIIIVEDEQSNPLSTLTLDENWRVSAKPLPTNSFFNMISGRQSTGILADLEAIDVDDQGFVYAITSHSRTLTGKRSDAREKLVRFKIEDNKIHETSVLTDIRKAMTKTDKILKHAAKVSDVKDSNGLNIEGMSFDKTKKTLLIGLRSPVIDDKAVIVVMKNPIVAFENSESPQFADEPIYLDLDKGGIRSITFDAKLNGYLIISRHEKKNKKFKLWLWNGTPNQAPRRVRIDDNIDLSNAEGITSIRHKGAEKILIVFDIGQKSKRKNGCFLFLDYDQLKIEP